MQKFFTDNKKILENFLTTISHEKFQQRKLKNLLLVTRVLQEMISRKSNTKNNSFNICTFNIKIIGDEFLNLIHSSNFDYIIEHWNDIIIILVRFCKEFEIRSDIHIPAVHDLVIYYSKEFYDSERTTNSDIYYALTKMPLSIIEEIYSEKYRNFKNNIDSEVNNIIETKLPDKQQAIENLKNDCNNYAKQLENYKQKFSFSALNEAFHKLGESKIKSKRITLFILAFLSSIIITIPIAFMYNPNYLEGISKLLSASGPNLNNLAPIYILITNLIPVLFVESMFIYYFKIILNQYNSISDQIVQLETKQAIMQFIESYVDYKKDKNLTNEELSKFEDIIFSQISPNLKDVPNSPDIMSLIENISKAIKK